LIETFLIIRVIGSSARAYQRPFYYLGEYERR
jgi:hypothetical protein